MNLPIFFPPDKDELLYSFFYRLCKANCLSMDNLYTYIFGEPTTTKTFYIDFHKDFSLFYNVLPNNYRQKYTMAELILSMDMLSGMALAMNREVQTRYICGYTDYYKYMSMLPKLHDNNYKVCPDCLKEDDVPYLHRSHQIPGVSICYKHGCSLMEIKKQFTKNIIPSDLNLFDDVYQKPVDKLIDFEPAKVYADAAHKLMQLGLDVDIFDTLDVLNRHLMAKGYKKGCNDDRFIDFLEKSVYSPCLSTLLNWNIGNRAYTFSVDKYKTVLATILVAYNNDIDLFISELKQSVIDSLHCDNDNMLNAFNKHQLANTYRCNRCGRLIVMTSWGVKHGILCPHCDNPNEQQFYMNTIKSFLSDGEYELIGDVKNGKTPIKLYHKICEKNIMVSPVNFVFGHKRCGCNTKTPITKAREMLKAYPEFELIKFNGSSNKAVFKHIGGCGGTFKLIFNSFFDSPVCRCCEGYNSNSNFQNKIKQLTGDEYELIGDYTCGDVRIKLLHKPCGNIVEMSAKMFSRGQRCRVCAPRMKPDKLIKLTDCLTSGRYKAVCAEKNDFADVIDKTTGKIIKVTRMILRQELVRPTPSDIIILSADQEAERQKLLAEGLEEFLLPDIMLMVKRAWDEMHRIYGPDDIILKQDLEDRLGYDTKQITKIVNRLIDTQKIKSLTCRIYKFADSTKEHSDKELFLQKYIGRQGKIIGWVLKAKDSNFDEDRYYSTKIPVYKENDWNTYTVGTFSAKAKGITQKQLDEYLEKNL